MCGGFIMCVVQRFYNVLDLYSFCNLKRIFMCKQYVLDGNLMHVFMRCNVAILHNYYICTLNNKMVSDCVLLHVNI